MSLFLALSTPALAFAGALLGALLNSRASKELEVRSRREETMRNLRWAAELAARDDEARYQLGVEQLRALGSSGLLVADQQRFVDAALSAVLEPEVFSQRPGEVDL